MPFVRRGSPNAALERTGALSPSELQLQWPAYRLHTPGEGPLAYSPLVSPQKEEPHFTLSLASNH